MIFLIRVTNVVTFLTCMVNVIVAKHILREKSLATYFGDSQFRRNWTFNFIVSKIYVDKRSRV